MLKCQIILLSCFKPMYSLQSNIPNIPNIFMRRKKSQRNVQIYFLWRNPQILERMNIFVNKYSGTLVHTIQFSVQWQYISVELKYTLHSAVCNALLVSAVSVHTTHFIMLWQCRLVQLQYTSHSLVFSDIVGQCSFSTHYTV